MAAKVFLMDRTGRPDPSNVMTPIWKTFRSSVIVHFLKRLSFSFTQLRPS